MTVYEACCLGVVSVIAIAAIVFIVLIRSGPFERPTLPAEPKWVTTWTVEGDPSHVQKYLDKLRETNPPKGILDEIDRIEAELKEAES